MTYAVHVLSSAKSSASSEHIATLDPSEQEIMEPLFRSPTMYLNAIEKLLRRFYEPLALLSLLEPTRGRINRDINLESSHGDDTILWRRFLDSACWVCDSDTGGDTVTAVGAQRMTDLPLFWLASNSNAAQKAREHLSKIFLQLKHLAFGDQESKARVRSAILQRCICFSAKRNRAYRKWIFDDLRRLCKTTAKVPDCQDRELLDALNIFGESASQPEAFELCASARELHGTETWKMLEKKCRNRMPTDEWSRVRHYIGRLGQWAKAVDTIIEATERFPQHVLDARVEIVGRERFAQTPVWDDSTQLEDLIRRMLSKDKVSLAAQLLEALEEIKHAAEINIVSRLEEVYKDMRPRPHAELVVLEHFYGNGLEFVHGDRYIGCSKPSCYCCDLYMQKHPGRFRARPCHGNLWVNWAPPIALDSSYMKRRIVTQRPQDHPTFRILQDMLGTIRQDVIDQIMSRKPRRKKVPDSTTGVSSVILHNGLVPCSTALLGKKSLGEERHSVLDSRSTNIRDSRESFDQKVSDHKFSLEDGNRSYDGSLAGLMSGHASELESAIKDSANDSDDSDAGTLLFKGRFRGPD